MKLIGKGMFTKAFLNDQNEVILHSIDPVKECQALWGFPESTLFVPIERIEWNDNFQVFKMNYYPKTSSLKKELEKSEYELYQALRRLDIPFGVNKYERMTQWQNAFDTLPEKFNEQKEILKETIDCIANYGSDICFEISPRNVRAVNGKLVLLDCFFLLSKLEEVTSSRKRH